MILTDEQKNEEVKKQVISLFELEAKFKAIKEQYDKKKEKLTVSIRNYMYCNKGANDEIQFRAQSGPTFGKQNQDVRVRRICPTIIDWDAEKLEENLKKHNSQIVRQVIHKQYVINDIGGLVEYLKSKNVSPSKFKSFLEVSRTVDEKALKQLDELGEIDVDVIRGCYSVREKASYLRLDVLKSSEDED